MIEIRKSPTADTRTCDFKNVTKAQLFDSSTQHIDDVVQGMNFFQRVLIDATMRHDTDKLTDIDGFHDDFVHGFSEGHETWWTKHRQINRHHLNMPDGVRDDVNLIDVLDYITDCVMAGMARSGEVYEIKIDPNVLMRAYVNTIELLKREVEVVE